MYEYMLFKDINLFGVMPRCINPEEVAGGVLHVHCCVHMTILTSFVGTRSTALFLSTGYLCNKGSKKRVLWNFTFFRLYKTIETPCGILSAQAMRWLFQRWPVVSVIPMFKKRKESLSHCDIVTHVTLSEANEDFSDSITAAQAAYIKPSQIICSSVSLFSFTLSFL